MLTFKARQQRFAEAYNFSILPDPESFGSATEQPEHPEHPPFAALPSWPEQSHVPRCMRRLTASTASATITKHIITVAGVISKGTIVEPPRSRCLGGSPMASRAWLVCVTCPVQSARFERFAHCERRAHSFAYAAFFSASRFRRPFSPPNFGMGRKSWNSNPASTTTATPVHTLNPPPERIIPN